MPDSSRARCASRAVAPVVSTSSQTTTWPPVRTSAARAPDRVLVQPLDVNSPAQAETAVAAALARFGRIDVLLNNAGYGIVGAVEETPEAEFRAQMETNFFGAVTVTKAVLPTLRRQRSGGSRPSS